MNKNKIELIKSKSGDWEVLKLNGKVYAESHKIPDFTWLRLLDELGCKILETYVSEDEMERGIY